MYYYNKKKPLRTESSIIPNDYFPKSFTLNKVSIHKKLFTEDICLSEVSFLTISLTF